MYYMAIKDQKQNCYIMKISLAISYLNANIIFFYRILQVLTIYSYLCIFINIENLIELTLVLYYLVIFFFYQY
jgi:hypothetical protein